MNNSVLVCLMLPAEARYFPVGVQAARLCAGGLGFDAADVDRICLALEEALRDALAFGYGGVSSRLEIELSRNTLAFQLVVRSSGLPLDTARLPKFDPARARDHLDTAGLGALLIESCMDKVAYSTQGADKRELCMQKFLPTRPATAQSPHNAHAPARSKPRQDAQAELVLRLARPEDADGISRLALSSHGTLMFSEHIYYPDRVREQLASGEMISVIGVCGEGELVGHAALVLKEPGALLGELTYLFVHPLARGLGFSHKSATLLVQVARERGFLAVSCLAVTSHVKSQAPMFPLGFLECALLLACSPASQAKDACSKPGRIGILGLMAPLRPWPETSVYAPARHRHMLERIFNHAKMPVRFCDAPAQAELPAGGGRIHVEGDFKEGWIFFSVLEYGADTRREIAAQLRQACAKGFPAIQLLLPLSDPATPDFTEHFEGLGFFFAGTSQVDVTGQKLALQYLNKVVGDYDNVHIHSEFGRELKEYVRSCDFAAQGQGQACQSRAVLAAGPGEE
jgi:anti-sigma regulatory factor (Ser/Thr protein kinase)